MKQLKSIFLGFFLLLGLALSGMCQAVTPNVGLGTPLNILSFDISGQWTTTTTSVIKVKIPFGAKVLGVSATARASGGTTPTLTVDVKEAGTTILTTPIAITAGTVSEAVIADNAIADEALLTVDLTIGGTTPTWNDITILITLARKN